MSIDHGRVSAREEEVPIDQREEDVAKDLAEVHATDQLFKSLFPRID